MVFMFCVSILSDATYTYKVTFPILRLLPCNSAVCPDGKRARTLP
jgi:hypothetical protein